MLHEDAELKISKAELLPKAHSLLHERFRTRLDLKNPVRLHDKETKRKTSIEFTHFILGAKSEKLEVASVHGRLMLRQKDFIIYFDDVEGFAWFDWQKIMSSGYTNHRVKGSVKIPMWNFKVSLGIELTAYLNNETQQDFWWNN